MIAYHFLRSDWRSGEGSEPPWQIGEVRSIDGDIIICQRGYHFGRDWRSALQYAPGPVACVVDIDEGATDQDGKGVSHRRKLLAGADCSRELRLFACECAERALMRERNAGREPDARVWAAVEIARASARGDATASQLAVARVAARDATWDAARDATWVAARDATWVAARAAAWDAAWATTWDAAWAAARDAAWDAAWAAELEWQRSRLAELLDARLAEVSA